MIRFMFFVLIAVAGIALAVSLKSCADRHSVVGPAAANFASEVAILGDGTPMFAPNGTVARTLADWLQDPRSTERYFEVGGAQFRPGAIEPLPEAIARLTRLAAMLQAYPDAEARIVGYAAPSGNGHADAALAHNRGQHVIDMLVADGVRRSRLGLADRPDRPAGAPGLAADRIGIILRYPKRLPANAVIRPAQRA